MFKKLLKNKRAQQTAEYALLISLVIAAVIAMQTYAQRAIQGKVRDVARYMTQQTPQLGANTYQYEPYYLESAYQVGRDETTTEGQDIAQLTHKDMISNRVRSKGGFQSSQYNTTVMTGGTF